MTPKRRAIRSPHVLVVTLQAISKVVFPSSRRGNRAVQAVEVQAVQQKGEARLRPYVFTFCLERVEVGPYKVLCLVRVCLL